MRDGRRGFRPPLDEADGPRLFIAVPLPDAARSAIEALVAGVRLAPEPRVGERRDPTDVRWVRMDGLHVTLRFLGPTAPDRIAAARAAVEAAAAGLRRSSSGWPAPAPSRTPPGHGSCGWAWPAAWRRSTS